MPEKDSILDTVKKVLGLDLEYPVFDQDIIMHINSVFSTLHQLGVGPDAGFAIIDNEAVWSEFIGETLNINSVKTYVALSVRLIFDPPTTSFAIASYKETIKEYEWRLNVQAENAKAVIVP